MGYLPIDYVQLQRSVSCKFRWSTSICFKFQSVASTGSTFLRANTCGSYLTKLGMLGVGSGRCAPSWAEKVCGSGQVCDNDDQVSSRSGGDQVRADDSDQV